ncbi:SPOR domain-containing protein [Sphingomonas sp. PAMC 26617]|uniref:SPOR domain-containing protein n=1 Tax=Sphingomonas sp. PAMC 26617 TaxID=1112216 RepID=UPI000288AE21|nr:SPOR domain-containing protein [Sphingomonas sp. PAMC 26617]
MYLPGKTALAALCAIGLIVPLAPARADVRDGVDAWSKGDYRTAVAAWRPAAEGGDADAQFNLAQAYMLGRGMPADRSVATGWFHKAALQDHVAAIAKYGLVLFDAGKRSEALPWLEKAAHRGEPRAQLVLGTMLFNGDSVARDWPRAYALLVRSAAADTPHASEVQAEMDRAVPVAQRQQGLELARQYEAEARRPQMPAESARPVAVAKVRADDLPRSKTALVETPRKPAVRPPAPTVPSSQGNWRVQLGAFGDPANARRLWTQMAARFAGTSVSYVKAGTLTRVLAGPYPSSAAATHACGTVRPCVAVPR